MSLRFSPTASSGSYNDLGYPFTLNQLIFDSRSAIGIQDSPLARGSLRFDGDSPEINFTGPGTATLSLPIQIAAPVLKVNASGSGYLAIGSNGSFGGDITEVGGARSIVINGTAQASNSQVIRLIGDNTFSGGVTLQSGNLEIATSGALGLGKVTINGGTFRPLGNSSSPLSLANGFSLNKDLVVLNSATLSGVLDGTTPGAGLSLRAVESTLKLTAASTYTGATTVDFTPVPTTAFGPVPGTPGILRQTGVLSLEGNGSILNSSRIDVRSGGSLVLKTGTAGVVDRVGDATPVTLQSGTLSFQSSNDSFEQFEKIGPLYGSGYSSVEVKPGTANKIQLVAASLNRLDRGTFLFQGNNLGSLPGRNAGNIFFDSPPVLVGAGGIGSERSILPYAVVHPGPVVSFSTPTSFATYDPITGVRPLSLSGEYASSLSAGAKNNVRIVSGSLNNNSVTVNALLIDGGASVSGSGTVTIASGALMNRSGVPASSILFENNLAFGEAEGNIFAFTGLNVTGVISGSSGLTKSGSANLVLRGNNSFTGPITINAGLISVTQAAALGSDTSPILFNGYDAGLGSIDIPVTISRDIELRTTVGRLEAAPGTLTITGTISGAGALHITSGPSNEGTVVLAGNNSYTGPTLLQGRAAIVSDSSLGNGGDLVFANNSRLSLLGPWVTARQIAVGGAGVPATIDTAGFDATLNGIITGQGLSPATIQGTITKAGAGRLTLTADSPFRGGLTASGGLLQITGMGATRAESVNVGLGGTFLLDNSENYIAGRVAEIAKVTLNHGDFRVHGHSTLPAVQKFGALSGTGGSVTLKTAGAAPVSAHFTSLTQTEPGAVLRGDNLGGGPGGAFTRITFDTPPAAIGGVIAGLYADSSSQGPGSSFAVYDTQTDTEGVIGIRPLREAEYATGAEIRTVQNGGSTPDNANFLVKGSVSAAGTTNVLNSLTLDAGSLLTLSPSQTIRLAQPGILARAGGSRSTITGGTVDFGSAPAVIFTSGELTISSTITGSAGLQKVGTGSLTLSNQGALAGDISVEAGTLIINGTVNDNGTLSADIGATLSGSLDTLRTVTISGTLAPGDHIGLMRTGALKFNDRATLQLEIASPSSYDQLAINGPRTFVGSVELEVSLLNNFDPADNIDAFTVLILSGSSPAPQSFYHDGLQLTEGSHFIVGNQPFRISYTGGDGNDVVLYAVPEPSVVSLLGAAGFFAVRRSRRRKS